LKLRAVADAKKRKSPLPVSRGRFGGLTDSHGSEMPSHAFYYIRLFENFNAR
jgi:hypothetical protein